MYRRSRSPASFSDRSLGSYSSGLSFGGYNTSDLVNTYSPRNRSVQRVINSDLGIHERSRSPLRDYSSPVSRAASVRPLPNLPPSPTLRRRDLSGLGTESRLSPIDWSTGEDYNFSVKPKSYYDFPSASTSRYNAYSAIGIKRPQRTDYSDYFRPLLTTKPMLKSGYVPRPRSERESAAEPIVRERKLIKFREITNDILSRVKRKVSWDIPDEISSPLINEMKSNLDATKENVNEPSRSRDSSLTKYGSREALNRDSSLTRYGSKETLSRDSSLNRSKLPEDSESPKSVSRRSSSHSMDRLSPRNLMRLATSRIKEGDPNTVEGPPKVVPRKKSLGAIHKERKSRKSSLEGLTPTEERSINYSVIADQIRRSRESSETKHHSPEKPEPEATPALVEESTKPESPPEPRARSRRRPEPPDEAPRPINRMHRKSVKYRVDKPDNRKLDTFDEIPKGDISVDNKMNLSITDTNISKPKDVIPVHKQNINQSENVETFKNDKVFETDKGSLNDVKGQEKKLSKSSSDEKVAKKALKADKDKSSAVKKVSKTTKSSTGKLKLGSKESASDNSSVLVPNSSTQSDKGESKMGAVVVKPDLVEAKTDAKESEEIVVVCKLPKKPISEVKASQPIPVDQNVVVSIVKGAAKSILVTDGEKASKILNIPTKLEAISENSNSSGGRKQEELKEESTKKQAEVNVIHTVVLKGKTQEDHGKVEEPGNNNKRLKSIPDVIQSTIGNIPLELNESNITPLSPKSDKQQLLPIKRSTSNDSSELSLSLPPDTQTNKVRKEKVTKALSASKSEHNEASLTERKTDIPTSNNTSNISSKPDIVQSQIIDSVIKPHPDVSKQKDSSTDSTTNRLKFLETDNSKNNSSEKSSQKTSHFRITQVGSGEKSKPYKKSVTVPNVDLGIDYKGNATSLSSGNIPNSPVEKTSNLKGKALAKVELNGSTLPQILSPIQKLDEHKPNSDDASIRPVICSSPLEPTQGISKETSKSEEQSSDKKLAKISKPKQKVTKTNEIIERSKIMDDSIPKINDTSETKSMSSFTNIKNENSTLSNLQKTYVSKSIEEDSNIHNEEKNQLKSLNLIEPIANKITVASPTSKLEKSNSAELPKSPKATKDSFTLPDLVSKDKKSEESKPIWKTVKLPEPASKVKEMTSRTKKDEEKIANTKQLTKTKDEYSKSKLEIVSNSTELLSNTKRIESEVSKSNQTISTEENLSKASESVSKLKIEDVPKLKEPAIKTKVTSKTTESTSKSKQLQDVLPKPTQSIPKIEQIEETLSKSEPSSKLKKEDAILKSNEPITKTNLETLPKVVELDTKKTKLEKPLSNNIEVVSKTDGKHIPDKPSELVQKVTVETGLTKKLDPCLKVKKKEDSPMPLKTISKDKKLDEAVHKNNENIIKTEVKDPVPKSVEPVLKTKLETNVSGTTELNSDKKKLESLSTSTENVSKTKKKEESFPKQLDPVLKLKKLDSNSSKTKEKETNTKIPETLSKITEDVPENIIEGNISSKANFGSKKSDVLVKIPTDAATTNKNLENASKTPKQITNSVVQEEDTSKTKQTINPSKIAENLISSKKLEDATPETISKLKNVNKEEPKNVLPKESILKDNKHNDASKLDTPSYQNKLESTEPPKLLENISKPKEIEKSVSKSETVSKEGDQEPLKPLNASRPCPAPETILEAKKNVVPDLLNHVRLENEASKPPKSEEKLRLPTVAEIPPKSPKQEKKLPVPGGFGLRFRYNQPQRSSYSSDSDSSSEEESESLSDLSCDEEGNKKGPCYAERRSLSSPDPITPIRSQKSRVSSTLSNQTTITNLSTVEDSPVKPKDPSKKLRFRKYDIDDFVFLKLLGKGSFGKVLLAELKGHDMYFAIKCLRKDVVLEDDDVESTMIERRVLALGTQHPYMCKLYCTFQTKSYLFFVMEYLNGGDLMFHIQESRPFEVKRAMFYGAEIVSALKFLHKRGIVYRDIKLDNVMLDADGHVRLVDFGMCQCRIYREECMPFNFCGTPNYIAPEIILGKRYNQSVDWWSLGVLLFEMLAGRSPFVGTDEDELFWCICNEEPFYPRFLTKESKDILENLLVKYPNKRLGMPTCPIGEIQDHPFFSTIDWEKLEKKQIPPPFKPTVLSAHDTNNFDSSFTMDSPTLSPVDPEILASMDQEQFQGFSYTNPHTTG